MLLELWLNMYKILWHNIFLTKYLDVCSKINLKLNMNTKLNNVFIILNIAIANRLYTPSKDICFTKDTDTA